MKLTKTFLFGITAGALALCMTACAGSSAALNQKVNQSLARSGAAYTVADFDAGEDSTVKLIKEAVSTYENYQSSLIDTQKLAKKMKDDGYAETSAHFLSEMSIARAANRTARDNFAQSLASFSARGIGKAYAVTTAEVADLNSSEAVANYVASLVAGNARVYISDILPMPILDDGEGSYTGECAYMRYVYIQYDGGQNA